jgi:hypothetical protein
MAPDHGLVLVLSPSPLALSPGDGVLTARRYREVGGDRRYLTCHDLASVDLAHRPELLALEGGGPPSGDGHLDRRVYRRLQAPPLSRSEDDGVRGGAVLCMWWTPAVGDEDDLTAWYDEEHTPMLMQIPGWLRVRRYALVEGAGPSFLALHDLESETVVEHPMHLEAEANRTPWWIRLRATRLDSDMRLFSLVRAFG